MTRTLNDAASQVGVISPVESAREAALAAQQKAGVAIRPLHELEETNAASALWNRVWEREGQPPVTPDLLRAVAHAGNYVFGAFAEGEMVGALLGFYGGDAGVDHVHSHILGVDRRARSRGVGFALKVHQRLWALERGIKVITWTYDPLVRANGYFNLAKLGAQGVKYLVNFYGQMPDAINAGDESDRVLLRWDLEDPRVDLAAFGTSAGADIGEATYDEAVTALEVDGRENPVARQTDAEADAVICFTPADIVGLRRDDAQLAGRWRKALRDAMAGPLARGLRVTAMTRTGAYILTR